MTKELTCICCPMGCPLKAEVDEKGNVLSVTGNTCIRGENYAKTELVAPVRIVTTTAKTKSGKPVPVKTKEAVPKSRIFDVVKEIKETSVDLPVKMGDVIVRNTADTGVDVVATRSAE